MTYEIFGAAFCFIGTSLTAVNMLNAKREWLGWLTASIMSVNWLLAEVAGLAG